MQVRLISQHLIAKLFIAIVNSLQRIDTHGSTYN